MICEPTPPNSWSMFTLLNHHQKNCHQMGCQLCKTYVKALFGFGAKPPFPAPANSSGGFYPGIPHKILFKTQARNRDVAVAFISRCDQRIPHLMCKFNCAANLENISLRRNNLSFLFIKPIDQLQRQFFLSCWFFYGSKM